MTAGNNHNNHPLCQWRCLTCGESEPLAMMRQEFDAHLRMVHGLSGMSAEVDEGIAPMAVVTGDDGREWGQIEVKFGNRFRPVMATMCARPDDNQERE